MWASWLQLGNVGELGNGELKASDGPLKHSQQRGYRFLLLHGGGERVTQGQQNAFDGGNGRFQIVRGRVDKRVQIHVGARELGVRFVKRLVGGRQLLINGSQFLVEALHLLAGLD